MEYIRLNHPNVTKLHFISDGPVTQYRNKSNFYLMSVVPKKYGFIEVKWTLTEAGHGKSDADGIGGVLKRKADEVRKILIVIKLYRD